MAQAANLLSATRVVAAAAYAVAFGAGAAHTALAIAIFAAASDFIDGRLARRLGRQSPLGQWLDPIADVVFVLTALFCHARAGAIPFYIPLLIALSFAWYAIDSWLARGSSAGPARAPIASRLGHWGGVVNYVLVLVLASGNHALTDLLARAAPFLAVYYVAAIAERLLRRRRASRSF